MYRFHVFTTSNQSSFLKNIYFIISENVEMKTRFISTSLIFF